MGEESKKIVACIFFLHVNHLDHQHIFDDRTFNTRPVSIYQQDSGGDFQELQYFMFPSCVSHDVTHKAPKGNFGLK